MSAARVHEVTMSATFPARRLLCLCPIIVLTVVVTGTAEAQQHLRPFTFQPPPQADVTKTAESKSLPTGAGLTTACNWFAQNRAEDLPRSANAANAAKMVVKAGLVSQEASDEKSASAASRAEWAIAECAGLLAAHAQSLNGPDKKPDHGTLVRIQYALDRLGKWHDVLANPADIGTHVGARAQVDTAREDVDALMQEHGVLNGLSAAVFAGAAMSGIGRVVIPGSPAIAGRIAEDDRTLQTVSLLVETPHWGSRGDRLLDLSLRLRYAITQPAAALLSLPAPSGSSDGPTVVLATVTAYATSVGVRAGRPSQSINGEFSVTWNVGATSLKDNSAIFDPEAESPLKATLLNNGVGRTAWYSELGVEFMLFDNPVRVLHAEKGLVTPVLMIATGVKYDSRFQPSASLTESMRPDDRAPRRIYFRFMVDALKALDRREVGGQAKNVDFGFGIEYERPLPGAINASRLRIPSSTRFIIRGDVNIVKALGGDKGKER
jgi:hypothetical protein